MRNDTAIKHKNKSGELEDPGEYVSDSHHEDEGLNLDLGAIFNRISHPKKGAFLENYPKFKMFSKTAEAIGVDRTMAEGI